MRGTTTALFNVFLQRTPCSELVSATTALWKASQRVNLRMKILSVDHLDLLFGSSALSHTFE